MWGAGKKSYNLTTTEKGTGREQINKSLPKEIRNTLGESKHEMEREEWGEKEKNIKHKWMKKHKKSKKKNKISKFSNNQNIKKQMDEKTQEIEKENQNLKALEESDNAPQREIAKSREKIRLLQIEKESLNSAYISLQISKLQMLHRERLKNNKQN